MIGAFEDPGTKEQTFNIIAAVEIHGEIYHFLDLEGCPFYVVTFPGNAVGAVKNAMIGEQYFKQGNTAAVFCIAMAYSYAVAVPQTFVFILPFAPAAGT
jgi:hypothetical protein